MVLRPKRVAAFLALATVLAASLVSSGSANVQTTALPTLYITYAMNCTFQIIDDSGKVVSSIVPGKYQVDVRTPVVFGMYPTTPGQTDWTACRGVPQFQLQGPGVDLFTTMTAGCEQEKVFPETFQANGTYVAQDLNQPSVTRTSFSIQSTGASTPVTVTYGGGKGKAEQQAPLAGDLKVLGTLKVTLAKDGTVKLLNGTKAVSKLAAGRYKFAITDLDPKASFIVLGPTATAPKTLTGAAFKGTHTVTLSLNSGKWTYYANIRAIHSFRVS